MVVVVVVVASLCYFPKTRDKTKHVYAIVSDKKQSKLHTMLFCLAQNSYVANPSQDTTHQAHEQEVAHAYLYCC